MNAIAAWLVDGMRDAGVVLRGAFILLLALAALKLLVECARVAVGWARDAWTMRR